MLVPESMAYLIKEKKIILYEYCAEDRNYSTSINLVFQLDLNVVKVVFEKVGYRVLFLARLNTLIISIEETTVHIQSRKVLFNRIKDQDHLVRVLNLVISLLKALTM